MDIEITQKINNPFLKRTEVHFTVKHANEKTPNREILRTELADLLNTKKEQIIIDHIDSSFGIQQSKGYGKVYSSRKDAEHFERKHILEKNKASGKKEKQDSKEQKEEEKSTDVEETTASDETQEEKSETTDSTKEKTEEETT